MEKRRRFRVWIPQVNQTHFDVIAANAEEAKQKAERKWRRQEHPSASYVADIAKASEQQ